MVTSRLVARWRRLSGHRPGMTERPSLPDRGAPSVKSTGRKQLMTASHPVPTSQRAAKLSAHVQKAALAVGVMFLAVGILGFVPGITTNYDQLTFAGHHSEAALLGIFNVSVLHNLVHLAFGIAGIALARKFDSARWYLIGGGVVYLLLFIYGLIIDHDSSANFVPVNDADNWLHLGFSVVMVALGVVLGRRRSDDGQPLGNPVTTQVNTPRGPTL